MQSLYGACQKIRDNGLSNTENIGGYDIFIEYYCQADLENGYSLGNSNQNNIVLLTDNVIDIPADAVLTVASPKKSLVILCDTIINNGTISMTGKGPNILPHDLLVLGSEDGFNDLLIPAYANNQTNTYTKTSSNTYGAKGNDGTNHACGAGGIGGMTSQYGTSGARYYCRNGSGTAFASGAGSGASYFSGWSSSGDDKGTREVNTTYPMRGGNARHLNFTSTESTGGVGYPQGSSQYANSNGGSVYTGTDQNSGVAGRIIIFCNNFINNGSIVTNGTDSRTSGTYRSVLCFGGASGGGAVDIFYNNLTKQGTITANGGMIKSTKSGGDGSITLTPMNLPSMIKPGYLGVKGLTKLITLIRDETASAKGDYLETNTIKLTKDGNDITADAKISEEANNIIEIKEDGLYVKDIEISQEQNNGLYRLDDGLYVRFASFTDDEILNIVRLMQSNSIDTNITTADFYAILTKEGYIVRLKEDSDG